MNIHETIERVMRATDEDDFDPTSLGVEFEKSGDAAFDAIFSRLDLATTSDPGRIRALRTMALLCRQFCVSRRLELMAVGIRMMEHPSIRVRSAAVHSAVFNASSMNYLTAFSPEAKGAALEQVREAVSKAIQRGLEPEQDQLARRFIASGGQIRVAAEE